MPPVVANPLPLDCRWIGPGSMVRVGRWWAALCVRVPDRPWPVNEWECAGCPHWTSSPSLDGWEGPMQCLLCDATSRPTEHVFEDISSCDCPRCGLYLFDVPFATFVAEARASSRARSVICTLRAIGDRVRRAAEPTVVTTALYGMVAAEFDVVRREDRQPVTSWSGGTP